MFFPNHEVFGPLKPKDLSSPGQIWYLCSPGSYNLHRQARYTMPGMADEPGG